VAEEIDHDRRRLLGKVAMTMTAAQLGMLGAAGATDGEPPELAAIGRATEWLNSPRLTAANLMGKVVVANFCTYTCINWLRTLPYVRAWSRKYTPGLVLIGVHTPEFPFERNLDNVRRAVRELRLEYPIVIDNDYSIWRAFKNRYWPALSFIDARGRLRQHQFGEGEYERSEKTIQALLTEAGAAGVGSESVSVDPVGLEVAADWDNLRSPENYLGYERTQNFASPGGADSDRRRAYGVPARLALNQWALAGNWTIGRQATVLGSANRADGISLSRARPPSRHGSAASRVDTLPCVTRRAATGSCSRSRRR
jgi:thioredoxin family protein